MLRLTVTRQGPDQAELQVDGRLVEEEVPLLAAEGARLLLGSRQLVLGLAGLTYIDPAGLGLLASWAGPRLSLVGATVFIQHLLRRHGIGHSVGQIPGRACRVGGGPEPAGTAAASHTGGCDGAEPL